MTFNRLILFPYLILVIAAFTIPSDGSHGLLSIKSLAYIGTAAGLLFHILVQRQLSFDNWKIACLLLASLIFLAVWTLVALSGHGSDYNEASAHSLTEHLKIIWLTVSAAAFTIYAVSTNLISFKGLLKLILLSNFVYSFGKIFLVTLHAFGVINVWRLAESFGIRFMSMDIFGFLPRFQTSPDIVTPFLLFFFLQSQRFSIVWNKPFRYLYLFITTVAIFLSFSRFLIAIALLSVILHAFTLKGRQLIAPFFIACTCLGLMGTWIGWDNLYFIFERRFLSLETQGSDDSRLLQVNALLNAYVEHPLFGNGLGGYAPDVIRDEALLYSYEVQWIAALMQFGLVGLILLSIPLLAIGKAFLTAPLDKPKCAFLILFLSWLMSGFTNPFLLSLVSGIVYSLFYLTGKMLSSERFQQKDLTALLHINGKAF